MKDQHSLLFAQFYLGHTQYTAQYQENMYKLLNLVNSLFCVNIPAKKLDEALVQTCINPYDVYCALSAGRETEQAIRLFQKLAELRDQDVDTQEDNIVEADKEPVRWLPSAFPIEIDPTLTADTMKIGDLMVKIKLPEK